LNEQKLHACVADGCNASLENAGPDGLGIGCKRCERLISAIARDYVLSARQSGIPELRLIRQPLFKDNLHYITTVNGVEPEEFSSIMRLR
jgi:hypothetical protein